METIFGNLEIRIKKFDINQDEIFQKNSRSAPLCDHKMNEEIWKSLN
jgi:hypothetical protein